MGKPREAKVEIPKEVQDIAQAIMYTHGLSKLQVSVIKWTADGKHNHEIADILKITPGAVQAHIRRAMDALGMSSRCSLVAHCLRRKIIE